MELSLISDVVPWAIVNTLLPTSWIRGRCYSPNIGNPTYCVRTAFKINSTWEAPTYDF